MIRVLWPPKFDPGYLTLSVTVVGGLPTFKTWSWWILITVYFVGLRTLGSLTGLTLLHSVVFDSPYQRFYCFRWTLYHAAWSRWRWRTRSGYTWVRSTSARTPDTGSSSLSGYTSPSSVTASKYINSLRGYSDLAFTTRIA